MRPKLCVLLVLLACTSLAFGGPARPCDTTADCLSRQNCKFPIGDCAHQNGYCTTDPACDVDSGLVCGCYDLSGFGPETYVNECEALAAGDAVAHLGACQIGASCGGTTCTGNDFCQIPSGHCDDYAPEGCGGSFLDVVEYLYETEGVCTPYPASCVPHDDPVCACPGVTYPNKCVAAQDFRSIAYEGSCGGGLCGGIWGISCQNPGDVCVQDCLVCSGADLWGDCEALPAGCSDACVPVCGCGGDWYRNRCEWVLSSNPTRSYPILLDEPAGCGEAYGLKFMLKTDLYWNFELYDHDSFNIYRSTLSASGEPGPWSCIDSGLTAWPYSFVGVPPPGTVWAFGVTAIQNGVEGSLGWGGSGCTERVLQTACAR